MSSASRKGKIYYHLCENKDSSCSSTLRSLSNLVSVTLLRLNLKASQAVYSQLKLSRCQHRTWLNLGWVRTPGAGSLVPVRGHISVRLSCSASLLKFQCQDPAWPINKGRLCVQSLGNRQATTPVKWQEMAWRPVTSLQEQTQHYLTEMHRLPPPLFNVHRDSSHGMNTTICTLASLSFHLPACLHPFEQLEKEMSECAGVVSVSVNTICKDGHRSSPYHLPSTYILSSFCLARQKNVDLCDCLPSPSPSLCSPSCHLLARLLERLCSLAMCK